MSTIPSTNKSSSLAIPKLHDDRNNWADYEPRLQKVMGSKGLWRHMEGLAVVPKLYVVADGIPVLADRKTPATDEQIESKEVKLIEYEKREYLAQHILLSTTSVCLGAKIKDLSTAKAMWKVVKTDVTKKSTSFLLDREDQLTSMKLPDNEDAKTHLSELNQHFQLMLQHLDNLV